MTKRILSIVTISLVFVAAMAGCSSGDNDAESTTVVETSEATAVDEGVEKQIQVGPVKVDCEGEGPQECLLIRENEMDPWQLHYSSIEGFTYEEGFLYDLVVKEQRVENPPAGASSISWVLVEEVDKQPVNFTTLYVGPEQAECTGEGEQLCYLVKREPDGDWEYFYSQIEGFEFEPGYEYELIVAEIPVANPPADASSIQYLLVEEVSKTPASPEVDEEVDLTGTIWRAIHITGQPVIEGSEILLGIAPGRIGGFSGCNTYFGPVESQGNVVSVGPLGSTRIACTDPLMDQESAYMSALESAAIVALEGNKMLVYDDAGGLILTYEQVEPMPLEETQWELTTYNNGENAMVSVLPDSLVTARFVDGQVSGSAGCNNYFGSYQATDDTIQIGTLASTMMLCAEPVNKQERLFLSALESAATYQIIANRLELISEDGALAAMFSAAEPVKLPGTSWNVISYNNGAGGVVSVIIDSELNVQFDLDTVSGSAGCNSFSGTYDVDGENISFGPLATTRKMCDQPEGVMQQESEFLAALEAASRYEIQGKRMDMYFEDGARALVLQIIQ